MALNRAWRKSARHSSALRKWKPNSGRANSHSADFEHMAARFNAQKGNNRGVGLSVVAVEPFGDFEADWTLRIGKLAGLFGRWKRAEDGHMPLPVGLNRLVQTRLPKRAEQLDLRTAVHDDL